MLAVILKNTILVVLMICIGFFLIDNHLQELSNELKLKNTNTEQGEPTGNASRKSKGNFAVQEIIESTNGAQAAAQAAQAAEGAEGARGSSEPAEDMPSADDNISRAMKIRIDDNMKEIYEYVFGDAEASDELKNMYETPDVPDKVEVCSTETTEKDRYDNMCKDPIRQHHDTVDYQYISMEPASNKSLLNIVEDSS